MFNIGMSISEMDKALYDKSKELGNTIDGIIQMLGTAELKVYIENYKKEKNINESDFGWIQKAGRNAFKILDEYQDRHNRPVFLDL